MAVYPGSIKTFTTKQNVTDVVDASHPNEVQDELRAVQIALGVNPHVSAARLATYADVDSRLESDETLLLSHYHTPGAPTTQAFGDAAVTGVSTAPAASDHKHGMPALSNTVVSETGAGQTASAGAASTASRGDHTHGSPGVSISGPTGVVAWYAANAVPTGWLACDGSAVNRTTYAALFAVIGTAWGAGDGSTTFNLPDLRGRAPVGAGQGAGLTNRVFGSTFGAETVTLATGEIPAHSHGVSDPQHSHGASQPAHNHGVSDPTHGHAMGDPSHAHGVSDPTHSHTRGSSGGLLALGPWAEGTGLRVNDGSQIYVDFGYTDAAGTGVSIQGAVTGVYTIAGGTGVTVNNATPGITINSAVTNVTTQNAGGGAAHANVQPSIALVPIIKT